MEKTLKMKAESRAKNKLSRLKKQVKNKYLSLQHDIRRKQVNIEESFKPVTDPLNQLLAIANTSTSCKNIKKKNNEDSESTITSDEEDEDSIKIITLLRRYFDPFIKQNVDTIFGITTKNDKQYLGRERVLFHKKWLKVAGEKYPITEGLLELIQRKKPDEDLVDNKDLISYSRLLQITNVHRRNYATDGALRGTKSYKYKTIIKPLLDENIEPFIKQDGVDIENEIEKEKDLNALHTGYGQKKHTKPPSIWKIEMGNNIEFVHWNEPNKLVSRLKKLIASKAAGHTGHDSEIFAIEEELRNAGYIK